MNIQIEFGLSKAEDLKGITNVNFFLENVQQGAIILA